MTFSVIRLYLLSFFLFTFYNIFGQSVLHSSSGSTPSVPSAAGMNYSKYADIPVNPATGTANFSVPIATLTEGSISTHIALNYHSAGIRVAEVSSPIGLGWQLSGGGAITRVINSKRDDDNNGGFYQDGFNLSLATATQAEVLNGSRDSESDIYSYSFAGVSGKFIFRAGTGADGNTDAEVVMIPKTDIKIEPYLIDTDGHFLGFVAYLPDGTTYYFGQYDPSPNATFARETIAFYDDKGDSDLSNDEFTTPNETTWFLKRIESYDGELHIDFNYVNHHYQFPSIGYCSDVMHFDFSLFSFRDENDDRQDDPDCENQYLYEVESVVLSEITTSTQRVTFGHGDREDLVSAECR